MEIEVVAGGWRCADAPYGFLPFFMDLAGFRVFNLNKTATKHT
jgi:hypothetical protein